MKKDRLLGQAISFRKRGCSIKEIAKSLTIAKSTASEWVRDTKLSSRAKTRLLKRIKLGQYNSAETKRQRKNVLLQTLEDDSFRAQRKMRKTSLQDKVNCSLLYWCEGAKDDSCLKFTNSDPDLAKSFIFLLRNSFEIEEDKFRPIIHIHSYHNEKRQLKFWSETLQIPIKQFMKSWRKQNTGKRIKEGYQGCVTINYYDSLVAKQLIANAKAFLKINRPVG